MANLRSIEKLYFEDLFDMGTGYVLDFTNNTFQQFFIEVAGVDIYKDRYASRGTSKANRMRVFWDTAPDKAVGKVLTELLERWEYQNPDKAKANDTYKKARGVVSRLMGGATKEAIATEEELLAADFADVSADHLPIDGTIIPILNDRIREADRCMANSCHLSAVFMAGSILEGALLGMAATLPKEFNQTISAPKDENGKVRQFHLWSLAQLIDASYEVGILRLDVKKFSHALRDFRNYIHPYQQKVADFNPDRHTAQICLQVLRAAIAQMSEASSRGSG